MPPQNRAVLWIFTALALIMPAKAEERPKLIVGIVVDQLRADYLERFHDQFGPGGFKFLMERGAYMTSAHYNYFPTVTGPGHASIFSGAAPAQHGIIANDWFDKNTGKYINCVDDLSVTGVGLGSAHLEEPPDSTDPKEWEKQKERVEKRGKKSPRNFVGSNFADQLRLHYRSKVIGVSIKDRGAILPSGKKPAGAYWFDSASGNFITSTFYAHELPEWVRQFNAQKRPESYIGQVWKRLLDPKFYPWDDMLAAEAPLPGNRRPVFDYTIRISPKDAYETIVPTPFGNQIVADLAQAAVEGENLGQGPQPDLLTVSFSAVDAVGHRFGPYSHEIQDTMLRLDRNLADFFSYLDKKIGLANVAILLTADHGVGPLPEFSVQQGIDGKRVKEETLHKDLAAKLVERFGEGKYLLVEDIVEGNIYLNHETLRSKGLNPNDITPFVRDWAFGTGFIQAFYSREQILDGRTPGLIGEKVFNGYNIERSGDFVLVYKPYLIPSSSKTGTTHGTPYAYDTHVPVILYGTAFKPGRYADEFNITDIAPTLCSALRMTPPSIAIGKPFVKALTQQ